MANNYRITQVKTFVTKDYGMFKAVLGNRDINLNNVRNIVNNIKANGLKPTVVIVNENLEIIDGQHRVAALKELGLPVYYQVHKGLSVADCVALNISSRKWTSRDYVESYAHLGNNNYVLLKKYLDDYKELPALVVSAILSGKHPSGGHSSQGISQGKFVAADDLVEVDKKFRFFKEIFAGYKAEASRRTRVMTALCKIYDLNSIDIERLKDTFIKWGNSIVINVTSIDDAVEKIENCYNYKKKEKLYFMSEYKSVYGA